MATSQRIRTWLQLFRAPNLFTVPGDPAAGYMLANMGFVDWSLAAVIAASVCFYCAGLLQNDLADEAEDLRERPNRPLPSGAANRNLVHLVLWILNIAGLAVLWFGASERSFYVGIATVVAVSLYNRVTKKIPVIGAFNMGLCRGLSLMIGACAGPVTTWQLGIAMAAFTLYIAAVTNLARHETRPRVPVLARILPMIFIGLGAMGGAQFALQSPATKPAAALFGLAFVMAVWLAFQLFRRPAPPLPPLIGAHIRLLLILQAAACYVGSAYDAGPLAATVLLVCWPISRFISRWFYAS